MIKKEEYERFIHELLYLCENENAKERTYREESGRVPNDFVKFGTIQNSLGRTDAYQKIYYRIKEFLEGKENAECDCK